MAFEIYNYIKGDDKFRSVWFSEDQAVLITECLGFSTESVMVSVDDVKKIVKHLREEGIDI